MYIEKVVLLLVELIYLCIIPHHAHLDRHLCLPHLQLHLLSSKSPCKNIYRTGGARETEDVIF